MEMEPEHRQEEPEERGEEGSSNGGVWTPSFPLGRVRKIVKIDRDIKKVNSEALHLISLSAELFLASFAARSRDAAVQKKRRVIKLEHIRSAARGHRPTSDFLLDSLPKPQPRPPPEPKARPSPGDDPLPPGTRRIDDFFRKPVDASQ